MTNIRKIFNTNADSAHNMQDNGKQQRRREDKESAWDRNSGDVDSDKGRDEDGGG